MHYCKYSQYHKIAISYNAQKKFLGHSRPLWGGGGGREKSGLKYTACYVRNSTLDKIYNFAPRHGISNNLASLESPNDGQSVAYES